MIVGTTILHDGTGTTAYYTPALYRAGEAATFSLDVTHKSGSPTLVVTIEHRNEDDTSWATAETFTSIVAAGVATKDASGLKELVRLAFTWSTGNAGDFMHVVIQSPSWRPYA